METEGEPQENQMGTKAKPRLRVFRLPTRGPTQNKHRKTKWGPKGNRRETEWAPTQNQRKQMETQENQRETEGGPKENQLGTKAKPRLILFRLLTRTKAKQTQENKRETKW